jgi:succinate dehydrogenase / fumarate reductase cytochrome b subunit
MLGFEDPDRPQSLERIIEACGAEPVDYPSKIKCCGFPIVLAREEVALGELIQPLAEAKQAGADAMVTPCPLCHLSLDAWQGKASREADMEFDLPIFHLAQLVGAAAGLTYDDLLFKRHVTKTYPATDKIYAAGD